MTERPIIPVPPGEITAHKCIHCKDGTVFLFHGDTFHPKGTVGHSKPVALGGIYGTIQCPEFNRLSSSQVWNIYKHRPVTDDPTDMQELPMRQS